MFGLRFRGFFIVLDVGVGFNSVVFICSLMLYVFGFGLNAVAVWGVTLCWACCGDDLWWFDFSWLVLIWFAGVLVTL